MRSASVTAPRIFISYRRQDCQAQANGLSDGLRSRLPKAHIFMDIDSIPFGTDFARTIETEIQQCTIVLVLIGNNWMGTSSADGTRRIDDPDDYVRLEVRSAVLSPNVRVLPVLVDEAGMPHAGSLPPDLLPLSRLNAIELSDKRWTGDLTRLTNVIRETSLPPRATPRSRVTFHRRRFLGVLVATLVLASSAALGIRLGSARPSHKGHERPATPALTPEITGNFGTAFLATPSATTVVARALPLVTLNVECKKLWPQSPVISAKPDGYWYRMAAPNVGLWAAANTFLNGDRPEGPYSHNTDLRVPDCAS